MQVVNIPFNTGHINVTAAVRQFSTDGDSYRAKHIRLKVKPLRNSHRKPELRLLNRRDGRRHDVDVGEFSRCPLC